MKFDISRLKVRAEKPRGPQMVLLKDVTEGIHPQFYVNGYPETVPDRPGCACPFCEKREKQGLPPRERYLVPIIDLKDNQAKMLSITQLGMRNIRELMEAFARAEETARLVKSQQERASAFKFSKMLYGAKR